jgi:hypothetical protein
LQADISVQNLPSLANLISAYEIVRMPAALLEEVASQRCARIYGQLHSCFELVIELEPFGRHRAIS